MIAVISDSHIPNRAAEIPEKFLHKVEKAEIAIHCGDFVMKEVYETLKSRANEFIAVKGNCENFQLDKYKEFELSGINFGVTHGTGITPRGHLPTLANIADKMDVKVLFHGHTHQMEATRQDRKILLNPGSCTGVGGGSARSGNPTMMTVEIREELKVRKLELADEGIQEEQKNFQL